MKLTKCPLCGSKKMRMVRGPFKAATRGGDVTFSSVPRQRCSDCAEEFFGPESNRILDQYLKPKPQAA